MEGMTVDRSGVAKIEGGYRKISDFEIVIIAKALGVTPNELLTDATDKQVHEVLQDSYRPPRPPHTSQLDRLSAVTPSTSRIHCSTPASPIQLSSTRPF